MLSLTALFNEPKIMLKKFYLSQDSINIYFVQSSAAMEHILFIWKMLSCQKYPIPLSFFLEYCTVTLNRPSPW